MHLGGCAYAKDFKDSFMYKIFQAKGNVVDAMSKLWTMSYWNLEKRNCVLYCSHTGGQQHVSRVEFHQWMEFLVKCIPHFGKFIFSKVLEDSFRSVAEHEPETITGRDAA